MKKHIEILTNWIKKSDSFFNEKYGKIMAMPAEKTNHELIEYAHAGTVEDFIRIWRRKLKKMVAGKQMPPNVLKKIESLPDLKTTNPNLLF